MRRLNISSRSRLVLGNITPTRTSLWTSGQQRVVGRRLHVWRCTVIFSREVRPRKSWRYFTKKSGFDCSSTSTPLLFELMLTDRILQRHLKRQIISLSGGFQIIADLNAYHGFVSSLKQQRITDDFANLKMLGHVYIVSDAKDLAQIVRDVTRYGGTFTPEEWVCCNVKRRQVG